MPPIDDASVNPLNLTADQPWPFPFDQADWNRTPAAVKAYILALQHTLAEHQEAIASLQKRIEELETRVNRNSSNSSQPPSSDSPFRKKRPKTQPGRPGGKKGHTGHRQVMLEPSETRPLKPELCSCGNREFPETEPYYTQQFIELPEIKMEVTHLVLEKGPCPCCGKLNKASIPMEYRTGYGPRLSAMIAQMAGNQGDSRSIIQEFCSSVLGIPISLGAIQKVIDRATAAIEHHYQQIGAVARTSQVNHIDETSFAKKATLQWLWVMANATVAFFMIHPKRSKEAFEALIRDWAGILVSDGYGLYCKWVRRQSCLAHLIRKARELSERQNAEIARFGAWALAELQRLSHMAHVQPSLGEWQAFYARFIRLITLNRDRPDDAGIFARRLQREMDSLWLFLIEEGVAPTNNHAERMLRFAVLWRKRSQGTASDKGNRWVERILTLRQTCRLRSRNLFHTLVDALSAHFSGQEPNLDWLGSI